MSSAESEPRLPHRSVTDTAGDVQRLLEKLAAVGGDNLITRTLANSPNGFRPYVLMSNGLLNRSVLPPRIREYAILAMARDRGARYEWWEHVRMSADAGVDDEERRLIADGRFEDPRLGPDGILAIRIATQLAAGGQLDDEDWASGTDEWGVDGMLDLVLTAGWWGGFMPIVLEALRMDSAVPDDERPRWSS